MAEKLPPGQQVAVAAYDRVIAEREHYERRAVHAEAENARLREALRQIAEGNRTPGPIAAFAESVLREGTANGRPTA